MKNPISMLMIGGGVAGLLLAFVGIQGGFAAQTENQNVSVNTSENEVQVGSQVTQNRPDGKTSTSVEGSISEDGAKVRIEQEHEFNYGVDDTLGQAQDTISDAQQAASDIQDKIGQLIGQ